MGAKDIVLKIVADTKDAVKGLKAVDDQAEKLGSGAKGWGGKLSGAVGSVDDIVGKLTSKMGAAGGAISGVTGELAGLSGPVAALGAGVAAFTGFVSGGVGKLRELYDETRNFNQVAGTSWEEGSKLIAVFDDLRVSADEGAGAMQKLATNLGKNPEALQAVGVEIAHTKDGAVDIIATLENVADAFSRIEDPTKRAALGNAAFGKSWSAMVPVLEQGGGKLRELISGVSDYQVASEAGAAKQDALFEATDNLHDALDGLQRSLAENIVPAITSLATATTDAINGVAALKKNYDEFKQKHGDPLSAFKTEQDANEKGMRRLIEGAKELGDTFGTVGERVGITADAMALGNTVTADAAEMHARLAQEAAHAGTVYSDLTDGTERLARGAKIASDSFKDWERSTRDALKAQEAMRLAELETDDATIALAQSQIRAGDESLELNGRAKAVTDAVDQFGASSHEAAVATEQHRRQVLEATSASMGAAAAALNLAEKNTEAAGKTLTAAERMKVYRDALIEQRNAATDPDLIASLDALIAKHQATAAAAQNAAADIHGYIKALNDLAGVEREFSGGARDGSTGARVVFRAGGGPLSAGQPAIVGENGPELFVPKSAGNVLSAGRTAAMTASRAGAAAGAPITINVSGVIGDKESLARELTRMLADHQRGLR